MSDGEKTIARPRMGQAIVQLEDSGLLNEVAGLSATREKLVDGHLSEERPG